MFCLSKLYNTTTLMWFCVFTGHKLFRIPCNYRKLYTTVEKDFLNGLLSES